MGGGPGGSLGCLLKVLVVGAFWQELVSSGRGLAGVRLIGLRLAGEFGRSGRGLLGSSVDRVAVRGKVLISGEERFGARKGGVGTRRGGVWCQDRGIWYEERRGLLRGEERFGVRRGEVWCQDRIGFDRVELRFAKALLKRGGLVVKIGQLV